MEFAVHSLLFGVVEPVLLRALGQLFQVRFQISLKEIKEPLLVLSLEVESNRVGVADCASCCDDQFRHLDQELEIVVAVPFLRVASYFNLSLNSF